MILYSGKTDKEAGYDRYCRRMGRDLKNIRQIGTPAEGDRIYIENAAYARVHEETYEERRVFIFMGHTECEQGVYMTFVEAAIPVRDMEFSQNLPRWGTHAWSDVFREIKRSYENSIIVGWALDCKGYPPRLTAELEAIHREQFGGAHQVLFLMDSMEGEEYFYLHKGNRLQLKNGFYIYYARELHEIRIPDVTIELPRRGTRQMLPEILTESKKRTKKKNAAVQRANANQRRMRWLPQSRCFWFWPGSESGSSEFIFRVWSRPWRR